MTAKRERLAELWRQHGPDKPDTWYGEQLDRSRSWVKHARLQLGLVRLAAWTTAEERMLEQLWRQGKSDEEIRDELNRRWPTKRRTLRTIASRRSDRGWVRASKRGRVQDYATITLVNELRRRGDVEQLLATLHSREIVQEMRRRRRYPLHRGRAA
jgi:predicted transcriptional regulator